MVKEDLEQGNYRYKRGTVSKTWIENFIKIPTIFESK